MHQTMLYVFKPERDELLAHFDLETHDEIFRYSVLCLGDPPK